MMRTPFCNSRRAVRFCSAVGVVRYSSPQCSCAMMISGLYKRVGGTENRVAAVRFTPQGGLEIEARKIDTEDLLFQQIKTGIIVVTVMIAFGSNDLWQMLHGITGKEQRNAFFL